MSTGDRLWEHGRVNAADTTAEPVDEAQTTETQKTDARYVVPGSPTYSVVDELIVRAPLVVGPGTSVGEVARRMTEADLPVAVVRIGDGCFGLVTDAMLRARVLVAGLPSTTPVRQVMGTEPPTVVLGDSAAEALMLMLDRDAEFLLVTDRDGQLRGVVGPRDFADLPDDGRGLAARAAAPGHDGRRAASPARSASRRCSASCWRGAWPPER